MDEWNVAGAEFYGDLQLYRGMNQWIDDCMDWEFGVKTENWTLYGAVIWGFCGINLALAKSMALIPIMMVWMRINTGWVNLHESTA